MDLAEQSERMQAFYSLKYDPFGALVDAMVFSAAGSRYDIAETIRHLLNYSEQDGLVIGHSGSGKRMLVQHVLKMLEEHWRIAWIDATDIFSPDDVLKEMNGQLGLGLKVEGDVDSLMRAAQQSMQQRIEGGEMFLMVVQFADRLTPELQSFVQSIRYSALAIESRVRQLWLLDEQSYDERDFVSDDWYRYVLEPFDEHDATQYLRDRMVAAGGISDIPFSEKDVARLNQLAGGSIVALNELARDFLIGSTFRTTERKLRFPLTHLIAGIAAASLVVIAVLYSISDDKTEPALLEPEPVVLSDVERRLAEAVARVEANRLEQEVGNTEPVAEQQPINQQRDGIAEVIGEPEIESAPVEVAAEAELPIETPVQESVVAPLKESLLTTAPAQAYTLQLIGVRDRNALTPLIATFADPSLADVVETQFESRPWFVLIYGQFDTRSAANAYIGQLPSEFKDQAPWIRTFEAVRQGSTR